MIPLSFSKIFRYATLRQEQLEMQKKIDDHLLYIQKYCPDEVADIYRLERNINRTNSTIVYNWSIFKNLSVIDKMIIQVTNFYENIAEITKLNDNIMLNNDIKKVKERCKMLNKFTQSYASNLKTGKLNLDNPYEHDGPITKH